MSILDMNPTFSIVLILVAAALALTVLSCMRSYARRKRHDLRQAREALDKHFQALEAIVHSPIPSDNVKRLMVQFSTAINQRSVAIDISRAMFAGQQPTLSSGQRAAVARILEEIDLLAVSKSSTATRLRDVIGYGFAAMFIRWPETDFAMSDVVVNEARGDVADKAAWVMSKIDDVTVPVRSRSAAYA
jgi:hypothetical protein